MKASVLPGVSRRSLVRFFVLAPFSLGALSTAKGGFKRGHDVDLVVRNGWILRADDLDRLA